LSEILERILGRPLFAGEDGNGAAAPVPTPTPSEPAAADTEAEAEPEEYEVEVDASDEGGEPTAKEPAEVTPSEPVDDGLEEVEWQGKLYKIPREVKPGLLMQADYTQKTQQLAEERKALAAYAEQQANVSRDRIKKAGQLINAEEMIRRYQTEIDWGQLEAENPPLAQTRMRELQQWQFSREELSREVANLDAQAEGMRQQQALAMQHQVVQRVQEAAAVYHRDIPNWATIVPKIMEYGLQQGWSRAELGMVPERAHEAVLSDPRVGKLLHKAWQLDQMAQKQQTAAQQRIQPKAAATPAPLAQVTAKSGGPSAKVSLDKATPAQYFAIREKQLKAKKH
jgi:hypothetical protein